MTTDIAASAPAGPRGVVRAPLGRLLRSELRMVLRRPRTLVGLAGLALVPVVAGIGIAIASSDGPGAVQGGIAALVAGNGLVLPIFALVVSLNMLLPLTGTMLAADAIAGEAAHGTLRGLLLAPVGRARVLAVKAFGVASVVLLAVTLMAVTGLVSGVLLLGGDGMLTTAGTVLPFWSGIWRVVLAVGLVTVQVWALAAVGLAVSAFTEHPLVVVVVSMGIVIVFGVLSLIPALDWLQPVLLTTSWESVADVVRAPMPTGSIVEGLLRAACYIVIGYSIALGRMLSRDG